MLTPGNTKLGGRLIWGFGLPSGRPEVCTGLSGLCQERCYCRRLEAVRPALRARYEANLQLSRQPIFEVLLAAFLIAHQVEVVRIHVGGDFHSPEYALKWLRVMRLLSWVRFYFYTRAWRDQTILPVLEQMAALPNCRVWYSCDRETGIPQEVPARARLAWLATSLEEQPPAGVDLVFRTRGLRHHLASRMNGARVCPAEDGRQRRRKVTCDRCRICWRALPESTEERRVLVPGSSRRIALPLVPPEPA
jgi:hypothetical protein